MAMTDLVVGASGLLGSAIRSELSRRGHSTSTVVVPWSDPEQAARALDAAVWQTEGDLRIWWCAGSGVTSSSADSFRRELHTLSAFFDSLAERARREPGTLSLFFASSAGGLYAGSAEPPFTEFTAVQPLSAYGETKVAAEAMALDLTKLGVKVGIARIANLYGPAQNLAKPQGLISHLCLAHYTRRPLNIYVSLDTLRDYLYAPDAAAVCVDFMDALERSEHPCITKVVASGRSVSIAELLADMHLLFKRAVPFNLIASPAATQQARDLRLRSLTLPELDQRDLTTLVSGIHQTDLAIGQRFRAGLVARR